MPAVFFSRIFVGLIPSVAHATIFRLLATYSRRAVIADGGSRLISLPAMGGKIHNNIVGCGKLVDDVLKRRRAGGGREDR
jgi:hypothetical protein